MRAALLRMLRGLYYRLPVSARGRLGLQRVAYSALPFLFEGTHSFDQWKFRCVDVLPLNLPPLMRNCFDRGRILVIDALTPMPDRDSGSLDMYYFLKIFTELGYDVVFCPDNLLAINKYTDMLQKLGVECLYTPYIKSIRSYLQKSGGTFDYVLLYRAHTAWAHIDDVERYCKRANVIFDTVDLHHLRQSREAELSGSSAMKIEAEKTKKIEMSLIRRADMSIILSTAERDLLLKEEPSLRLATIPLLREVPGCKNAFTQRGDIVFIGAYDHTPNVDAVKFFVREIWPLVLQKLPGVKFKMLGNNMPDEVRQLGLVSGVEAIGYAEEIDEYFNNCRISVAPLRFGAGIKGKIGTSASFGVPSVATTLAIEGMGMRPGEDILVADKAQDFAEQVITIYTSEELWRHISANALAFAENNYSLRVGREHIEKLLRQLGGE